ncbi:hypothetical protein [Pseudanabaena sp. FACHB-2040]|uniref:hypothetical protein n=1 Tax=Pseudanabaena sp. FACHB-2040 TaxID=2692859 RepID=UPI001683F3E0|nr:hypothetical protein [Pseudanabaena sp. FACHB-2040]MBD2260148.1 hypothetical protein [Pseudanabaena sp. FACHB-2040]
MNLSWQLRFRAILTGLVLADMIGVLGPASSAQVGQNTDWAVASPLPIWKPLLIQMGEAISREVSPDWAALTPQIQSVAEHPVLLSLSALPLLLLNLEGPGRGQSAIAAWAGDQGLQPQTQATLLRVFQLLQQGMGAGKAAAGHSEEPLRRADLAWLTAAASDALLAQAIDPVIQARGQYDLALRQALAQTNSQPWVLPLVGVLTAIHGGLTSLPLAWRLQVLNSPRGQVYLLRHWSVDHEERLWQLADGLFYRWIGVSPRLPSEGRSGYPVLQMRSQMG